MTTTDWRIQGVEFVNCNCAWGCPCQFNALPTNGDCEALWAMRIDRGHLAGTSLDGLAWGFLLSWPGAVHEGNGRMQVFGDERATPAQRQALESIAHGEFSDEGTYFQIFSAMAPNFQPSVWRSVEFSCDVEGRTARLVVDGLIDATVGPIHNPLNGSEHRVRVALPNGFEYLEAEYASGTTKSQGPISLNLSGTHAHLARVGWDAHRCLAG